MGWAWEFYSFIEDQQQHQHGQDEEHGPLMYNLFFRHEISFQASYLAQEIERELDVCCDQKARPPLA